MFIWHRECNLCTWLFKLMYKNNNNYYYFINTVLIINFKYSKIWDFYFVDGSKKSIMKLSKSEKVRKLKYFEEFI